jgi:hypothetical protein
LIDHLPSNSYYGEALADDDELARAALGQPDKPRAARVRMSQWSAEVAAMSDAIDRLGLLVQTIVAVNGGKPPKIPPAVRPITAADRVKHEARRDAARSLAERVLPPEPS